MREKYCLGQYNSPAAKAQNILWGTRTYLVGNMEHVSNEEGEMWRDTVTRFLHEWGVVVFNPYHKPFIKDVQEGHRVADKIRSARQKENYAYLEKKMRQIRIFDLNLVDRSDFIIACINPLVPSWGSAEEIVTAARMKKPIFLAITGGKIKCPNWIFGMIPHKYIYDSCNEIMWVLNLINSGHKKLDNDRWKLLRKEYR